MIFFSSWLCILAYHRYTFLNMRFKFKSGEYDWIILKKKKILLRGKTLDTWKKRQVTEGPLFETFEFEEMNLFSEYSMFHMIGRWIGIHNNATATSYN